MKVSLLQQHKQQQAGSLQMDQVWRELSQQSAQETAEAAVDKVHGDVFYESCSEAQPASPDSSQSSFDQGEEKQSDADEQNCRVKVTVTTAATHFQSNNTNNKLLYVEPTTYNCPLKPSAPYGVTLSDLPGLWKGLSPSCLLYTSPSPRDQRGSRMPSSA